MVQKTESLPYLDPTSSCKRKTPTLHTIAKADKIT